MLLYLIQHGDAVDKSADPERPLSETGKRDVDAVGRFLEQAGLAIPTLWHSGKTRARQTAERLAPHVAPNGRLLEVKGLGPGDPVKPVGKKLGEEKTDLAIIGHLPYLARLAGWLLTGDEDASTITFERGAVLCLERDVAGRWHVRWMIVPSLL